MQDQAFPFRTALGGFRRGDVAAYITQTAAAHQSALSALQAKLDALEQENAALRDQLSQAQAEMPAPEPPSPAAPAQEAPSLPSQELAAYRRAEAAERLACQRAKALYARMETLCQQAGRDAGAAGQTARDALNTISAQLSALEGAAEQLCRGLETSAGALKTMDQLLPDPAETLEEP